MKNARDELECILSIIGLGSKDILWAYIKRESYYMRDRGVHFVLSEDHGPGDVESFLESLDFSYDDGYGSQEIFGNIALKDGTWLSRWEYDGSEGWVHVKPPVFGDAQDA